MRGAADTELAGGITGPDIARGMRDFRRAVAIPADAFARTAAFAIGQPEERHVSEILLRPTRQVP